MDKGIPVYLRRLSSNDISLVEEWLNKPHIIKWFGDPQEWLNEIHNDQEQDSTSLS
ncbi:hypothetical protein [Gorillibacterium timonense]|uniref:hypothetical protein n=1 Tax=Gorillibacterium timonense TaxID=1689269 RepID=UPI00131B493D|nr:hypothetical protein [Gorillibacterium timonense]